MALIANVDSVCPIGAACSDVYLTVFYQIPSETFLRSVTTTGTRATSQQLTVSIPGSDTKWLMPFVSYFLEAAQKVSQDAIATTSTSSTPGCVEVPGVGAGCTDYIKARSPETGLHSVPIGPAAVRISAEHVLGSNVNSITTEDLAIDGTLVASSVEVKNKIPEPKDPPPPPPPDPPEAFFGACELRDPPPNIQADTGILEPTPMRSRTFVYYWSDYVFLGFRTEGTYPVETFDRRLVCMVGGSDGQDGWKLWYSGSGSSFDSAAIQKVGPGRWASGSAQASYEISLGFSGGSEGASAKAGFSHTPYAENIGSSYPVNREGPVAKSLYDHQRNGVNGWWQDGCMNSVCGNFSGSRNNQGSSMIGLWEFRRGNWPQQYVGGYFYFRCTAFPHTCPT